MNHQHNRHFSRRAVLKGAALLAAAVATAAGTPGALAQGKASKTSTQYRDSPNGKQECSNCMQFIPGKKAQSHGQLQDRRRCDQPCGLVYRLHAEELV